MMPRNGAVARSEQLGTLSKLVHTMFVDPEIGRLLDEAEPWAEEQGYDSLEASLVRVVRRDYEKLVRVPPELSAEMSRTAAIAEPVWEEARKAVRLGDVPAVPREGRSSCAGSTSTASSPPTRTTTSSSTTTSRA